jgi:YfiH family protein
MTVVSGLPWRGVRYFCTLREGGVSVGPLGTLNLAQHVRDEPSRVAENRARLGRRVPVEPLWLDQVHGINVFDADIDSGASARLTPVADAAVTTRVDRVLAIMTADCLPIVITATDGLALGVAHAGWRGLAGGVLEQTLARLRAAHPDAARAQWRAWVGPAISQRHFEVGADVFSEFVDQDALSRVFFAEKIPGGKWLADLPGLARHRLHRLGVGNIELSGYCTYDQAESFYSYRRDPLCGRMATVAWLSGVGAV